MVLVGIRICGSSYQFVPTEFISAGADMLVQKPSQQAFADNEDEVYTRVRCVCKYILVVL